MIAPLDSMQLPVAGNIGKPQARGSLSLHVGWPQGMHCLSGLGLHSMQVFHFSELWLPQYNKHE